MSLRVLGIGTAVPAHRISQQAAAILAQRVICRTDKQARVLAALYERAGVSDRYTVLPPQIAVNWITPTDGEENQAQEPCLGPTTAERMRFFEEHAPPLAHRAAQRAIENAPGESDALVASGRGVEIRLH